jgi:hypothetical protein
MIQAAGGKVDMSPATLIVEETPSAAPSLARARPLLRVRAVMRQGTAASLPETWERYGTLDEARAAIKHAYHDDRVLRMFIVRDEVPPRFVEWVER